MGALTFSMSTPWDWDNLTGVPGINQSHHDFRDKVRAFVDKELIPYTAEGEEKGDFPPELHKKAYEAGVYGAFWPEEYGGTGPFPSDSWHMFIYNDQLGRNCAGGLMASLLTH